MNRQPITKEHKKDIRKSTEFDNEIKGVHLQPQKDLSMSIHIASSTYK